MGYAGICYSCQNDVLKQHKPTYIICPSCSTEWKNNYVRGDAPKAGQGLMCWNCKVGILMQSYPNTIFCGGCGTKWTAYRLKGYSKRAQQQYELKRGY
jgi:hypothetical protein